MDTSVAQRTKEAVMAFNNLKPQRKEKQPRIITQKEKDAIDEYVKSLKAKGMKIRNIKRAVLNKFKVRLT